jgi:mevalonate pyrophosphate decarboxylase
MRAKGIPAWYSMNTGPSVFVNTYWKNSQEVAERLHHLGFRNAIVSDVGRKAILSSDHLF